MEGRDLQDRELIHGKNFNLFATMFALKDSENIHTLIVALILQNNAYTSNVVITAISDARTHEEEDFFTMVYGMPLKGDKDEKCLSLLISVEEIVSCKLRACKAQASRKKLFDG
ncbi:hypothetical protein IEQ34_005276 [Dendrobium chrysotoxum]|uniref:Uncharacterized protein n=1 Tax=Dendrobium chrysotoxum TaxID=161865 RepID=A0AAV7HC63_DENCH|nr:hypothetical protein IEQ34_005276 [Dendrobium chrysotoxum]